MQSTGYIHVEKKEDMGEGELKQGTGEDEWWDNEYTMACGRGRGRERKEARRVEIVTTLGNMMGMK